MEKAETKSRITDTRRFDKDGKPIPGNVRPEEEGGQSGIEPVLDKRLETISNLIYEINVMRDSLELLTSRLAGTEETVANLFNTLPPEERDRILSDLGVDRQFSGDTVDISRHTIGFNAAQSKKGTGGHRGLGSIGFGAPSNTKNEIASDGKPDDQTK